jgi:tetratricopeptide (TPR) repeat protein
MPDPRSKTRSGLLEEMVERDPTTALYLPMAERLREEGRVEEAVRLCEARKNRPGHGVGDAIVLARCYLAAGRLHEARTEFESALALDRENVAALKALAGILAHEGRHIRAAELYRAVCRVDPGDLESQTALHQITSGEYADVCPADVVVEQGDLGWQPVRLPREEDHLSDLGLGLRTLEHLGESYDAVVAEPARHGAPSFQELSLEELERATARAADAAGAGPDRPEQATPAGHRPEPEPAEPTPFGDRLASPEPPRASEGAPGSPTAPQGSVAEPVGGNRSAFEDWVRRLGGGA